MLDKNLQFGCCRLCESRREIRSASAPWHY